MSFTELSQVHNVHISNDYYLWQASPRSTLSLARTSPKAANIHNRWWRERNERNLRFHSNIIKMSSKRANIGNNGTACLCSPSSRTILPSFMGPQASLPAAAQPAVMDVRPLRGRSLASRHRKEKRIVPIVSIVFKTSASKERKECGKWSLRSLVISH